MQFIFKKGASRSLGRAIQVLRLIHMQSPIIFSLFTAVPSAHSPCISISTKTMGIKSMTFKRVMNNTTERKTKKSPQDVKRRKSAATKTSVMMSTTAKKRKKTKMSLTKLLRSSNLELCRQTETYSNENAMLLMALCTCQYNL